MVAVAVAHRAVATTKRERPHTLTVTEMNVDTGATHFIVSHVSRLLRTYSDHPLSPSAAPSTSCDMRATHYLRDLGVITTPLSAPGSHKKESTPVHYYDAGAGRTRHSRNAA